MTHPAGALVAIDLGTSSTCVAVGVPGEPPRVVLVDGAPLTSSAVYAEPGGLVVGAEADRRAALDPARYEPHPKRRVDEGSLLMGTAVVPVGAALAAVLGRAVAEARATLAGRPVSTLVLTHPADWGGVRTGVLRRAAAGLAEEVVLLPEPVAAAVLHGRDLAAGSLLAVLDVGGGTTDVSVLRRGGAVQGGPGQDGPGFVVLATGGDPGFGGADLDEALLAAIGRRQSGPDRARWDAVLAGRGLDDRRRARALRAEVRSAKEALSRHSFTDVALPAGLPDAHVARDELEALAAPRVREVVALLARVLARAGALAPDGRSRAPVFLVGGSSRVPLVGREVHRVLGVVPVATDQPETVVARGAVLHAEAARAARARPEPVRPPPVPAPTPPPGPVPGPVLAPV
ncbi:Hsp70 family protein, partial [Rhodococcus aerolatus]